MKTEIATQGHWHLEGTWVRFRRPGLIVMEFDFEQKRPQVALFSFDLNKDREVGIGIESRGEDSLYFRDGEDGSVWTHLTVTLPRTLPWRRWDYPAYNEDKWDVTVVFYTRNRYGYEYPYWVRPKNWNRVFRKQVLCRLGKHWFKFGAYDRFGQKGGCVWCGEPNANR